MKFKILTLFVTIFTLAINVSLAQEDAALPAEIEHNSARTILVAIEGMACQEGCADKISSNLTDSDGVVSSEISFENKNGLITFQPTIITIEEVKAIITNTKVKDYNYTITSVTPQNN
ncbi:copper chaperone CopZ [Maribacter caenipelagi]|uniref:Copper chaperone CopZ n=1 Tax=Maribacter caenipelagi TaxID=1447781 RepID=A0A4R7CZP2_9FLAO|nr:heavy-metal-associated domain-containing protein [Maribacter caenipelagi]TDS12675.1 copper chaperone CopZ [Maribacter caenipelagi]